MKTNREDGNGKRGGRPGFTLVELLVVIAIIAILMALVLPMVQGAVLKARMMQVVSNGRSISQAMLAEIASPDQPVYPPSTGPRAFADSTAFCAWLVTGGVCEVTFDFFGAPGLPSYHGGDAGRFKPEHNAWCVTADVHDGTRNETPLLFTRNLDIARLDEGLWARVGDGAPFGRAGVAVVFKGGNGAIMNEETLDERFNPLTATNKVLRP
jgi:prepilin-type N-terminal cleavage/methylation domain-containing protein